MEAMKAGNDALEELHREVSLDAVEKLMQDTEDAIATHRCSNLINLQVDSPFLNKIAWRTWQA